jgi:uncharacterized protein YkwD
LSVNSVQALAQGSVEAEFLDYINKYRAAQGLGPVVATVKLTDAAKWMSQDMAQKDYMNHTDSQGRDPFERMEAFGYNYNTYKAENLAAGQETGREAYIAWRNSPGHNKNMLDPNFKAIGISRVYNPISTYKW